MEFSEFAHAWAARNLLPLGVRLVRGDLRTRCPSTTERSTSSCPIRPISPPKPSQRTRSGAARSARGAVRRGSGRHGAPRGGRRVAARLLVPGGYFVMEHAEVQAGWIAAMLERSGLWSSVTTHLDLNGRERATSAVRRPAPPAVMKGCPVTTSYDCADAAQRAAGLEHARASRDHKCVVLPTDTVYGIAADAFSPQAVTLLLAAKGRGGPCRRRCSSRA